MLVAIVLSLFIIILSASYLISKSNESYWKKRNVPYHGGKNMMADFFDFIFGSRALFEIFNEAYHEHEDAPAVAMAAFLNPTLMVKEPENVQQVLMENFKSFHDRAIPINENDKLADSVLFMRGGRWKVMRQKMSPLFTSSKLRNMHYIMDKSAQDFIEYLKVNKVESAFNTLSLFCCAAISAAVFGVGTESTFESPFLDMAKKAISPTLKSNLRFVVGSISPSLHRLLKLSFFSEFEKPFIGAIKQLLRRREKDMTGNKHDFAELAVMIQKSGVLKDDVTGLEMYPTDELLAAQGFFFLIAGVEPSATGMFFTLFELAKHPEMQKRVQTAIDEAFEKNEGKIDYDAVSGMEYLEKVVDEALRMYPPITSLNRLCMQDTVLPVGNIRVSKGTSITVPVYSMHHDPKYFPNPEVFDPDRFSPENRKKMSSSCIYLPFGEGSRICIGARFARLQIKTGLSHILRHFSVETSDQKTKVKFCKLPFAIRPANVDFRFVPRNLPR